MGRRLTALSNDSTSITYSYDASGQRVSKTVNGVTTEFYYDDRGVLVLSSRSDGTELRFYADAEGNIDSFSYNNEQYYYVRNAQNDILGITDKNGAFVARYSYDEWGAITSITDGNGVDVSANLSHIANLNPLRYRSYFYDAETGFYWLNTRYYDPAIGRFINADSILHYGIGYNIYSYCKNNPISYCDCGGRCEHPVNNKSSHCKYCLSGIEPDEEDYNYPKNNACNNTFDEAYIENGSDTFQAAEYGMIVSKHFYIYAGVSSGYSYADILDDLNYSWMSKSASVFGMTSNILTIGAEAYNNYLNGVPDEVIKKKVFYDVAVLSIETGASWLATKGATWAAIKLGATAGSATAGIIGAIAGALVGIGVGLIIDCIEDSN